MFRKQVLPGRKKPLRKQKEKIEEE